MSRLRIGIILAVISASAGCATRHAVDTLQRQLEDLQSQNFQLRKDLAEAQVRLQMEREGETRGPSRLPAADIEASSPAPALSKVEPTGVIYSEPITDASRYTSGPLPGAASKGRSGPGRVPAGDTGPMALMNQGKLALDRKDPDGAMQVFQQILARHSGDGLTDDAQFGIGECHFQLERYEEAIAAYRLVVSQHAYGDQVPAAMLKIGFCHLALQRRGDAMETFRTVSETYPGTEAATIARQQIAHLKASAR